MSVGGLAKVGSMPTLSKVNELVTRKIESRYAPRSKKPCNQLNIKNNKVGKLAPPKGGVPTSVTPPVVASPLGTKGMPKGDNW